MSDLAKNAALNIGAGVVSSLVVLYLDREGLTRQAYIVFGAYLVLMTIALVHVFRKPAVLRPVESARQGENGGAVNKGPEEEQPDIFHSILALVAKYHSQNYAATPSRIAADLSLAPEVTLAYMWEYHNKLFITFNSINGGGRPDVNTPFFLCPAAWQHIKVVRA